jgi:PKD repeat protein
MKNKNFIFLLFIASVAIVSCKKEDAGSGLKSVFSYTADGFKVNFTNFSSNATEYRWDFGDNTEGSTLSNPVHVFTSKGSFLVSLTAKNATDSSVFVDTVLISGPNIKIDGDFTDWTYVEFNHVNEANTGGTLLAVKTFATPGYLNFYLEGTADFNLAVVDIYLDTDNNPETGLKSWMYPVASGADFLMEGNYDPATPDQSAGSVFSHIGPGNDWAWNEVYTFADVIKFSKMSTNNGNKAIEFSIKRDGLGTMKKKVNFAIIESNSGWTEIGSLPADQTAVSQFGTINL